MDTGVSQRCEWVVDTDLTLTGQILWETSRRLNRASPQMIERQVHCRQWHGTKNERAAKILFHNPVCRLFPKTWKLSQTCIDLVTGHFDSTQKCHVCPSSPIDGKSKFRGDESKVSCNLWISVSSDFFFQMISNRVC